MIELRNISSGYQKQAVLCNINTSFPTGRITGIIGRNGSGKSTLLKTVAGIIPSFSGDIVIDGTPIDTLSRKEIAKKISYLAQNRQVPDITVEQAVLHGRFPHLSYPHRYSSEDKQIADSAINQMNLTQLKSTPLSSLSGGMLQKTFIAMALVQDTNYILLDEPTTHLDVANQISLMKALNRLADNGKGVITVIHDLVFAMEYSHIITIVHNGGIIVTDTPENIFNSHIIPEIFGVTVNRNETTQGYTYYYEKI